MAIFRKHVLCLMDEVLKFQNDFCLCKLTTEPSQIEVVNVGGPVFCSDPDQEIPSICRSSERWSVRSDGATASKRGPP